MPKIRMVHNDKENVPVYVVYSLAGYSDFNDDILADCGLDADPENTSSGATMMFAEWYTVETEYYDANGFWCDNSFKVPVRKWWSEKKKFRKILKLVKLNEELHAEEVISAVYDPNMQAVTFNFLRFKKNEELKDFRERR
jgi:hypothetical protein